MLDNEQLSELTSNFKRRVMPGLASVSQSVTRLVVDLDFRVDALLADKTGDTYAARDRLADRIQRIYDALLCATDGDDIVMLRAAYGYGQYIACAQYGRDVAALVHYRKLFQENAAVAARLSTLPLAVFPT
jgi:hypothetical protein